ncbi:MAG: hypothetical protein K0R08_317 [Solimicrobium sp.]|jgi:hypothetical protein|nr:hypothetical protein [Solimicrobium sp.]
MTAINSRPCGIKKSSQAACHLQNYYCLKPKFGQKNRSLLKFIRISFFDCVDHCSLMGSDYNYTLSPHSRLDHDEVKDDCGKYYLGDLKSPSNCARKIFCPRSLITLLAELVHWDIRKLHNAKLQLEFYFEPALKTIVPRRESPNA